MIVGGGFRENQHPVKNHSHQPQYYNLRTTPFGESLRHHRTNSPAGSYSSYEHQQQQPSAAGIQLVAQYGVAQV